MAYKEETLELPSFIASNNYPSLITKTIKLGSNISQGQIMARETAKIKTSNAGPFTFVAATNNVIDIAVAGGGMSAVTFTAGTLGSEQTASAINAVFPGLAKSVAGRVEFDDSVSVDIQATSTALAVLGLTPAVYSNSGKMVKYVSGSDLSDGDPVAVLLEEALALTEDVEAECGFGGIYVERNMIGLDDAAKMAFEGKGIYFK